MSSSTTRTGLVPAARPPVLRILKKHKPASDRLPAKFEAKPMPLLLRPYGGLYNPFAKGCSVLCNHPAPTAVKDMIQQFKSTLAIEGNKHLPPHAREKAATPGAPSEAALPLRSHAYDHIPEDLFRRYTTDSDSRPLTPTPTVTSVHTRTSAGSFLNRRCITPELGKNEIIKRKKIILDLRRSHSQETLYWKHPASEMSQSVVTAKNVDAHPKPKSAGDIDEKKEKFSKSLEQRPKSSLAAAHLPEGSAEQAHEKKLPPATCINEHDLGDEDVRRGKKRKKLKTTSGMDLKPSATFHLSEDPETQVATLGPDSMNPSTRPSLIPNSTSLLLPHKEKRESETLLKGSFLTDEAFQALKPELDIDLVENTFGRYLNRALREAIKYIPHKPKANDDPEKVQPASFLAKQTQMKMPRKFSKSATRFEVPLNLKSLEEMTVLEYLSKFVWVSRQRKQLYKRVFVKFLKKAVEPLDDAIDCVAEDERDEADAEQQQPRFYVERTMGMESLPQALEEVLEFHGNERNVTETLRLLDFDGTQQTELDFRSWCGVVSFAERLSLAEPNGTDSCDELEKTDFSSLEQYLDDCKLSKELREVFDTVRRTHGPAI